MTNAPSYLWLNGRTLTATFTEAIITHYIVNNFYISQNYIERECDTTKQIDILFDSLDRRRDVEQQFITMNGSVVLKKIKYITSPAYLYKYYGRNKIFFKYHCIHILCCIMEETFIYSKAYYVNYISHQDLK